MGVFTEFKQGELLDAICAAPDRAFPELHFEKKSGAGYLLTSRYHINGDPDKGGNKRQTWVTPAGNIKEWNGEKKSLVDYYREKHGLRDFTESLTELASLYGLSVPSTPEYEARRKQQEAREAALDHFKEALFSDDEGAKEVLSYLHGRGWTDEEIKAAGLGYADEASVNKYIPEEERQTKEGKVNRQFGTSHRLFIPWYSGTSLYGFEARDIHTNESGKKYRKTKYCQKGSHIFALSASGSDCIVVEGELDALHATVRGVRNVVATSGGQLTEEPIKDAMRRGFTRFNLFFDMDERGQSFIDSSVKAIQEAGGEAWIIRFPDGEKAKDVDEYLKSHTAEELNEVVAAALPSFLWDFLRLVERYSKGGEATLTLKQREDFYGEFGKILNAPTMKPENRELLKEQFRQIAGGLQINLNDCEAYLDNAYYRNQATKQAEELNKEIAAIQELNKQGKRDEAIKRMAEAASTIRIEDKATEFATEFAPVASLDDFLGEIPTGIPTGYAIGGESLTLNAGLTFICAPTSHGKTSFLNNLALIQAERNRRRGNGETVLYFSYEVDKRRLLADLLNTYVNDKELSKINKPLNAIKDYFKSKSPRFFANGTVEGGASHYNYFQQKKAEFESRYIRNNALCVVDKPYKVEELLEAISYYCKEKKPSVIFLDYAQLIYSEKYGAKNRTEELKAIVNQVKDFANKNGLPFVMAAQFKNEVVSPLDVTIFNIGESKDLGMIADTAIGLFNLSRLQTVLNTQQSAGELKKLLKRLTGEEQPTIAPIPNKLYAKILKNRNGESEKDDVLEWEGRTKYITPNNVAALKNEATQTDLPFPDEAELSPMGGEDAPF